MALTLGFVVLFFAGVAVAYFAGAHAARLNNPSPPYRTSSANKTSHETSQSGTEPPVNTSAASLPTAISSLDSEPDTVRPSPHETDVLGGQLSDTRRYERLTFTGTALATIYPPQQQTGGQPVHCEVQTRDLCCSGIGIAHTQRLLPQQTIILDVVGKLLVGEVRWCQRVDKDLYIAGCRLIKTTT
jgi:hypothetical protein